MIYDEDKKIVIPYLIKLLKTGKYNSSKIITEFYSSPVCCMYKWTFNDSKIREIVNYIRREKIEPLLSDRTGYWISTDVVEIYESYNSLMDRIESMTAAANGLKTQMNRINRKYYYERNKK